MSVATAPEIDPVALTRELIRCPSVTPRDEGALDRLGTVLEALGFQCVRLPFESPGSPVVDNLYARLGDSDPNFCFAGHTDVVPTGRPEAWQVAPFAGDIRDGFVWGRGAADMKGAIACFVAAVDRFVARHGRQFGGSISLLITGDEEGPAINGTVRVLDWLKKRNEPISCCLVGEPTNPQALGEMIKIGRRGSLNARLTVRGTQGHTAYPHLADNPIDRLVRMLAALTAEPLDAGTAHFPPSTLAVTTVDVGNAATNVIPAQATAGFNIRFNNLHSGSGLTDWIRRTLDPIGADYDLDVRVSGDSFLTPPGRLSEIIAGSVEAVLGVTPQLSTTGGTSDARFIKDYCPVAEFGLVGATMHKVDERVAIDDLLKLSGVYEEILDRFFRLT